MNSVSSWELLSVFTDNTSVNYATAVSAGIDDVRTSMIGVAASQNSVHKPPTSCLNTVHPSDARDLYKCASQDYGPVIATLTCDIGAKMQKPLHGSNNFNKIFQTSDLELTDADLEFNPK